MRTIAVLAGKGGVRKSTLARAIGVRLAQRGFTVVGADMEVDQASFVRWMERRKNNGHQPTFPVQSNADVRFITARLTNLNFQYGVIDGAAYASRDTLTVAHFADFVVLPTGYSVDDVETVLRLAASLVNGGVSKSKLLIAFCGVVESKAKHKEVFNYILEQGWRVTGGFVPLMSSYSDCQDFGQAITEVRYVGLRLLARDFVDDIIDRAQDQEVST